MSMRDKVACTVITNQPISSILR